MLGNSLQSGAEAWNFGEEKRLSHDMSFMYETAASQHRVRAKQKDKRRQWDVPEQIAEYSIGSRQVRSTHHEVWIAQWCLFMARSDYALQNEKLAIHCSSRVEDEGEAWD